VTRPSPLGVPCPSCRAPRWTICRVPGIKLRLTKRPSGAHPAREDAALAAAYAGELHERPSSRIMNRASREAA
jgi:hypothetical protein